MKIIHFSDPHGGGGAEDWLAYFDKRWVGVFNYRFRRRFRHDLTKLERAVEYILATRPDIAVCTGDLTSSGQPGEFERVLKILAPLRDSDIPLIYVPGNHDCYVKRPKCVAAMKHAVTWLTRGNYSFDDLPAIRECNGVELLLLNTSRPSNLLCSWGFVNRNDSELICRHCRETPKNRPRILITHYPLIEKHQLLRLRHRLFGQRQLLQLLKSGAIDLSLVGHVHHPRLEVDGDGRGECIAGSVTRNGSMVEIDCDTEKSTFTFHTVEL